ncbi:MAG TPA: PIN domain-containing protein [Bryobacteraceae bacterium]
MLVDTNLLVRTLQPHHPLHRIADGAIEMLRSQNRRLYLVPQNLIEFWTVATRPVDVNGLGLSTAAARTEIERLERFFTVLRETPALYPAWKRLVFEYQVSGKSTYDARLVAAMQVHGITSILTFNPGDFRRYADIEVVDPATVVSTGQ